MGQCGCGDIHNDGSFSPAQDVTITIDLYHGCKECHKGIGVTVYAFDEAGRKDWLQDAPVLPMPADEYGGANGTGFNVEIFSIDDLKKASDEIFDRDSWLDHLGSYESFSDWLDDYGLELIQSAMGKAINRNHPTTTQPMAATEPGNVTP